MVELTISELKNIELEMFKYFRDLCNQHGWKYYMMGGTLLGAVRHGGFIPWDDDIDVMMPRKDYDKLVLYFSNHSDGRYQLADYRLRKDYTFPIGKLMDTSTVLVSDTVRTCEGAGAFIDIFPLDNVKNPEEAYSRMAEMGRLNTFLHTLTRMLPDEYKAEMRQMPWKEQVLFNLVKLFGIKKFIQKYDMIARTYNDEDTEYCGYIVWILHKREIWSKDILGTGTTLYFENEPFNAPDNWEQFLKTVYGDYMQLPPEEKRVTRHSFKVYRK